MMKYILLLSSLIVAFTYSAFGQEIDKRILSCQYRLTLVKDSTNPTKLSEDLMILELGKRCSKFYSYYTFLHDSLMAADIKAGVPAMEMIANPGKHGYARTSNILYCNYPDGNMTTVDKILTDRFCFNEPLDVPPWQIKTEYDTILGYRCQKAICTFKGRSYVAWFASGIPVNGGLWQFAGLPGLILKVVDTRNQYNFQCVGIKATSQPIVFEEQTLTKVSKREYRKTVRRFYDDPVGFMESSFGATITPAIGGGKKSMPYNPIDLTL